MLDRGEGCWIWGIREGCWIGGGVVLDGGRGVLDEGGCWMGERGEMLDRGE